MTGNLDRRLAWLERRLRPRAPDEPFTWLRWSTRDELEELERLAHAEQYEGRELTAAEQLRAIECEAAATRRRLAGEPEA
jgi:hypothetical protein